jgi:orotidine-5'-phosphate decarboxylase
MASGDVERAEIRKDITYLKDCFSDLKAKVVDIGRTVSESCATRAEVKKEVEYLRHELSPYVGFVKTVVAVAATTLVAAVLSLVVLR